MSSPTMDKIMELLTCDLDPSGGVINFPFDIELHCREQDILQAKYEKALAKLKEIANHEPPTCTAADVRWTLKELGEL